MGRNQPSVPPSLALDQLTLARCALYADLLHGRTPGEDAQHTKAAIAGLRQAGTRNTISLVASSPAPGCAIA